MFGIDSPIITVLQVGGFRGNSCARIDLTPPSHYDYEHYLIFGYPPGGGNFILAHSPIGDETTPLADITSDAVSPVAMVGAPVLNLRTGGICGLLGEAAENSQRSGISVIPWSAISDEPEWENAGRDLWDLLGVCVRNSREDKRWAPAVAEEIAVDLVKTPESSSDGEDQGEKNLIFRIYIPSDRLYATEASRLLSLFHDWLIATRGHGIRQSGYRTATGEMYEFFADASVIQTNLREEFDGFSNFLEACIEVTGQVHLAECRYAWSGWRAEVTGNARVSARSAWV